MEAEERALECIRLYVRYGFYRPAEIERIVGEDMFSGALARKRIREMVGAEVERLRAEQSSWPAVTDCDRLDRAFATLEAEGILALHNAGLTQSEGIGEMSERYFEAGGDSSDIVGYCFYQRQDMEHALATGELFLSYGDINGDGPKGVKTGERICAALESAGLNVKWSGSIKDKLVITAFRWQRRM